MFTFNVTLSKSNSSFPLSCSPSKSSNSSVALWASKPLTDATTTNMPGTSGLTLNVKKTEDCTGVGISDLVMTLLLTSCNERSESRESWR